MGSPARTKRLGAADASPKGPGAAGDCDQPEGGNGPTEGVFAGEGIGSGELEVSAYRTLVEELSMTGAQFLDLVVRRKRKNKHG